MSSVDPGEGWRLLSEGELIPENAEWKKHKGDWVKAHSRYHVGGKWTAKQWVPFRVPIKPIDSNGVEVTTSGPYVAIEVHRAALAEIERLKLEKQHLCAHLDAKYEDEKRLKAELEAVKQTQPSPEPEWFDLTPFGEHVLRPGVDQMDGEISSSSEFVVVKAIGCYSGHTIKHAKSWGVYTQFRCLLKDAPPELLAMASRPAEDPDEWVTQDRVPYRKEFDQCKWDSFDEWNSFQDVYPHYRHGFVGVSGRKLEVRCRRRDLPPMPEQPKTEREVLLYWYDGNVVGRYADCPPTDPSFVPLIVRDGKVFIEAETREVVR